MSDTLTERSQRILQAATAILKVEPNSSLTSMSKVIVIDGKGTTTSTIKSLLEGAGVKYRKRYTTPSIFTKEEKIKICNLAHTMREKDAYATSVSIAKACGVSLVSLNNFFRECNMDQLARALKKEQEHISNADQLFIDASKAIAGNNARGRKPWLINSCVKVA